jgi:uncharacterized membrane protein (UPF0127 family)
MYNFSKNKNIILLLAITLIMIFCDSSLAKKTKKIIKLDPAEFNTNFKNYNQKIIIVNNYNQNIAEFMVAIADNDEKRGYGLMNLDFLPENLGMLFLKESPQEIFMWMKDTKIPLDMLFISPDLKINHIEKNTKPFSLDTITSGENSIGVLEINGGVADKLKIKDGYKILISQ